jgi:hypothetical protein
VLSRVSCLGLGLVHERGEKSALLDWPKQAETGTLLLASLLCGSLLVLAHHPMRRPGLGERPAWGRRLKAFEI